MILQVFSVYDKAVQAYLQPFFARSRGEALRSFSDACADHSHNFYKHAVDYTLVYCGDFDDQSGVFSCADPSRVVSAVECVTDDPFPPAGSNSNGQRFDESRS